MPPVAVLSILVGHLDELLAQRASSLVDLGPVHRPRLQESVRRLAALSCEPEDERRRARTWAPRG